MYVNMYILRESVALKSQHSLPENLQTWNICRHKGASRSLDNAFIYSWFEVSSSLSWIQFIRFTINIQGSAVKLIFSNNFLGSWEVYFPPNSEQILVNVMNPLWNIERATIKIQYSSDVSSFEYYVMARKNFGMALRTKCMRLIPNNLSWKNASASISH